MKKKKNQGGTRQVVLGLEAKETVTYRAMVVVEVPSNLSDEEVERMPMRAFDGVRGLDWQQVGSTGVWPGSCGSVVHPVVLRDANGEVAQVRLAKPPERLPIVITSVRNVEQEKLRCS